MFVPAVVLCVLVGAPVERAATSLSAMGAWLDALKDPGQDERMLREWEAQRAMFKPLGLEELARLPGGGLTKWRKALRKLEPDMRRSLNLRRALFAAENGKLFGAKITGLVGQLGPWTASVTQVMVRQVPAEEEDFKEYQEQMMESLLWSVEFTDEGATWGDEWIGLWVSASPKGRIREKNVNVNGSQMSLLYPQQFRGRGQMPGGRWLGLVLEEVPEGELGALKAASALRMTAVEPESPADDANLKSGDVIVEVDGEGVESLGKFKRYVDSLAFQYLLPLTVLRDGKRITVEVEVGVRPGDAPADPRAPRPPVRRNPRRAPPPRVPPMPNPND